MINKDEWLHDECRKVKLQKHGISTVQFVILSIFCLLVGGVSFVYCKDDFFTESAVESDELRATWTCVKCGFKNYEGIERCSVCGRKR